MQNTYNILLVHCRYNLAGGEDAVFAAEREMLQQNGHRVTVYLRSNAEATGADAPRTAKLVLPLQSVYSHKTVREVRALIRQNNIQLVHVHNTLLVVSPSVFWAARAEGVPVVQTLHNFRLFCPAGVLLRGGSVCEDCPHNSLLCAVRHRCYRGSLAQSAVCAAVYGVHRLLGTYRWVNLIALTEFDRQKLLDFNARHRVFTPARLYCKPNPVSVTPRPPLPWAQRENQIVFAGRLEELKGLRTAIKAWKQLPDPPRLLVAGEGPLAAWAKAETEKHHLNIEFLGHIPPAQLQTLLAQSRAALCPSLCYESFALVPAEAHAVGTPVLASALGNVGASVTPGVDGLHFTPGDAASLAGAVCALGQALGHMDAAAMQASALAAYAPAQNYAQLMAIYRDILQTKQTENAP